MPKLCENCYVRISKRGEYVREKKRILLVCWFVYHIMRFCVSRCTLQTTVKPTSVQNLRVILRLALP